MVIETKVNIDLQSQAVHAVVNTIQGDQNTRCIKASIYSGGTPWEIPADTVIAMRYRKPDGTKGYYDAMPDGQPAAEAQDNLASVLLAPQMLTVPGSVSAQLEFINDSRILGAGNIVIHVAENPAAGTVDSEDYVNWLSWMQEELQTAIEEADFTGPQGEPGGYYIPAVQQTSDNELQFTFTPSSTDMPAVEAATVALPASENTGVAVDLTGYATEEWVEEGYQPKGDYLEDTALADAVNEALDQAKASGAFDGADGTSVTVESVSESTADGGSNVVTFSDGTTLTVKNGSQGSAGADGKDGEDYVLTDDDKAEIASQVAALLTTETWTFTLEDGSSVTKAVLLK